MDIIKDFRGVSGLVIAELLTDTKDEITYGDVEALAGAGEVTKTTETSSASKYYDNVAAIVASGEGADTINLSTSVLSLSKNAKITGKKIDPATGALVDGEGKPVYFALGYVAEATDGSLRYVWRHKGRFAQPDEAHKTKDAGTDSNGQTLVYTGISTLHAFSGNDDKPAKAVIVDDSDTKLTKEQLKSFFVKALTIDTLSQLNGAVPEGFNAAYGVKESQPEGNAVVDLSDKSIQNEAKKTK